MSPGSLIRLDLTVALLLLSTCCGDRASAQVDEPAAAEAEAKRSVILIGLEFSRDGSSIVTGGDAVRVFDAKSGELTREIVLARHTPAVAFSPADNGVLATGGDDELVRLWDVSKPEPLRTFAGHTGGVNEVCFSPDGKLLVSTSYVVADGRRVLGQLKVWDAKTGKAVHTIEEKATGLGGLGFSPDGKRLAFARNSRDEGKVSSIAVYSVETWKPLFSIPFAPGFANTVSFTPDGKRLIVTGGICVPSGPNSCRPTGKIWFADPAADKPAELVPTDPCDYFRGASLTPMGDRFATGTATVRWKFNSDGVKVGGSLLAEIQMRDAKTGKLLWMAEGEVGDPYGVEVSPDGKLVGCCSDKKVLLFDADTGVEVRAIPVGEE